MRGFTVGFVASLATGLWLRYDVAIGIALLSVASLLVLPLFSRHQRLFLVGFCAGGLLAHAVVFIQLKQQLAADVGRLDVTLVGTVISVPTHDSRRTSFLFRIDSVEQQVKGFMPDQIRLSWYGGARRSLAAGDQWRLVARLKPSASLGNPGGFNYEQWLFHNRVHASGYVKDKPSPQRLRQNPKHLHALRETLAKQIVGLPAANGYAALIQGLTVGVTNGISVQQWETLRQSGTAHLLAISGLHIGLVSGWFYAFAAVLWRLLHFNSRLSAQYWCTRPVFSLAISALAATLYAALAGFSLPTQRALIMLGVFGLSVLLRRIWPPSTALLIALLVVLLLDPLSVLSVGFWLSFGTVSALFYLHSGRITKLGAKPGALWLHLKLGFILLPATAWFFQQGSMIAPVANAIAVPVVGLFVVPVSFVIALVTPFWPAAANLLLQLNQWVLKKLLLMLEWLLQLPAASLPLYLPGPLVLLCALLGLLLLFAPRGLRMRWLAIPLIAPAIVVNMLGRPVEGLELHVLDVGQGLAAVLLTENHTVLFDTGKKLSEEATMFDRVVTPFLISQGRSTIDVSILSHADDDHAGGAESLIAQSPKTRLYSSDKDILKHMQSHNVSAQACVAGDRFLLDDVSFVFLHPGVGDFGSRNNQSCVLLVHYGHARLLLTGDIEAESEKRLVERMGESLPLSALVAPHHGSRSSSTPDFVAMWPADNVVFAAGSDNKFGFPHADVVERYQESGSNVFTTGEHGAVFFQFDQQGLAAPVQWFWHNKRRYRRQ